MEQLLVNPGLFGIPGLAFTWNDKKHFHQVDNMIKMSTDLYFLYSLSWDFSRGLQLNKCKPKKRPSTFELALAAYLTRCNSLLYGYICWAYAPNFIPSHSTHLFSSG